MELQPHQKAAVDRLREAISDMDEFPEHVTDDAEVRLVESPDMDALSTIDGPLTLGHLRDIASIFGDA